VRSRDKQAFTLVELLMVIGIIAVLASLLLVSLASAKAKSRQTACLNNLRQLGLGFGSFALNQDGKYPADIPTNLGGSMEFKQSLVISNTTFSRDFHHFAAVSNEVPTVKVMTCPADRTRRPARDYGSFGNDALSYWVNVRATPYATASMLAGDWNVHAIGARTNEIVAIDFGKEVHQRKGSVLFADGRVEIAHSFAFQAPAPADVLLAGNHSSPTDPLKQTPSAPGKTGKPTTTTPSPPPGAPPKLNGPGPSSKTPAGPGLDNISVPPPTSNQVVNIGGSHPFAGSSLGAKKSSSVASDSAPLPDPLSGALATQRTPGATNSSPAESTPEWDTPGFRLFKMLAIASYLISLLWAIIVLLLLYLRSRVAKRAQEQEQ
jgi:prepilin-type N-terminal cleavage/methylation domain-containing protein/prepilin-type processing-associated H-X9-DG protein